jgi:hypothetical protein
LTNEGGTACSLGASQLERRLAAIAAIGAESLISRSVNGPGRHLLHFRQQAGLRDRLEQIVAAETECCSFLDLRLAEERGALVLSIAAQAGGQAVADGLAAAFSPPGG